MNTTALPRLTSPVGSACNGRGMPSDQKRVPAASTRSGADNPQGARSRPRTPVHMTRSPLILPTSLMKRDSSTMERSISRSWSLQAGALPAFISRSIWSAAEEISSARSSALSVYERRCAPSCWRSSSLMTKTPQTPPTRVVVSSIGRMRRQLIRPSAAVPRSDIPSSA
ncbi:Uncharacterised protein [Acinetobacter baumannii]|nr:Uncharacterised protein [Acinetobacter baumannii]